MKSKSELVKNSLNLILLSMLFNIFTSCVSTYKIIDYYMVSNSIDNNQLFCNPSFQHDPVVEYVKSIKWGEKIMIVEQELPNKEKKWFIIIATRDSLMCGCHDTLIGPMTQAEKDSMLNIRCINEKIMKESGAKDEHLSG